MELDLGWLIVSAVLSALLIGYGAYTISRLFWYGTGIYCVVGIVGIFFDYALLTIIMASIYVLFIIVIALLILWTVAGSESIDYDYH